MTPEAAPLEMLYLWVHPGYSVNMHMDVMTPEEAELLEMNKRFCATLAGIRSSALAIIHYKSRARYEAAKQGKYGTDHPRWIAVVDSAKALVPQHVEVFGHYVVHHNPTMVTEVGEALLAKGLRCDDETLLIGIGETSSSCVPGALCSFADAYGSLLYPVVKLDQTNARKADRKDDWKEGAGKLTWTRQKYPSVRFEALPQDF
jgi:hypothetical protein